MSVTQVDIRIPVSPTAEFALMLRVLYLSLRRYSGLSDWRLTAFVGASRSDQESSHAFAAWLEPEIECVIVPPDDFERNGVHATAEQRLMAEPDADIVLMMDADMVVCGSLEDQITDSRAGAFDVAGVVAHVPPHMTRSDWTAIYRTADLEDPVFPYRYTGWPLMFPLELRDDASIADSPPYFNYGYVYFSASGLRSVQRSYQRCLTAASEAIRRLNPRSEMFVSQVALTLSIAKSELSHGALGLRYNFPNDRRLEAIHPQELEDARVIHLLRRNKKFDKQRAYCSFDSLNQFANSTTGDIRTLERAKRTVVSIMPELVSRPLPAGLAAAKWEW